MPIEYITEPSRSPFPHFSDLNPSDLKGVVHFILRKTPSLYRQSIHEPLESLLAQINELFELLFTALFVSGNELADKLARTPSSPWIDRNGLIIPAPMKGYVALQDPTKEWVILYLNDRALTRNPFAALVDHRSLELALSNSEPLKCLSDFDLRQSPVNRRKRLMNAGVSVVVCAHMRERGKED